MKNYKTDALKYDLVSLINLQNKRIENIRLFEASIDNEKKAIFQEDVIQTNLETKLNKHNNGLSVLDKTAYHLIQIDLPKIKSTKEKRNQTISLLRNAIFEEQNNIDYESKMIDFLRSNGSKD